LELLRQEKVLMNFEHLTLSSIMERKLSFILQSLSQPSISSTGKKSVERYEMKAIKFPGLTVITIFSQIFPSDKPKRFSSNSNHF